MKIIFIQTGGTIDKDYPQKKMGYAFEITEPAVASMLKSWNPSFEYEIIPLLKKDSTDLDENDRQLIREYCENVMSDKIIITHGTDTMITTGKYLAGLADKTIIITGAMRPAKFINSDAAANIGTAIGAIRILEPGVYIAMHGWVLPVKEVSRNEETGQFIPGTNK